MLEKIFFGIWLIISGLSSLKTFVNSPQHQLVTSQWDYYDNYRVNYLNGFSTCFYFDDF